MNRAFPLLREEVNDMTLNDFVNKKKKDKPQYSNDIWAETEEEKRNWEKI